MAKKKKKKKGTLKDVSFKSKRKKKKNLGPLLNANEA